MPRHRRRKVTPTSPVIAAASPPRELDEAAVAAWVEQHGDSEALLPVFKVTCSFREDAEGIMYCSDLRQVEDSLTSFLGEMGEWKDMKPGTTVTVLRVDMPRVDFEALEEFEGF